MHNNTRTLIGFLLASLITSSASAALYDRGNGMIYDSAQNITWMQNANAYFYTNFSSAQWYINELTYGGHSDWRLPSSNPINELYNEVPVPAAAWLMGSGLICLTAIKRRKKK